MEWKFTFEEQPLILNIKVTGHIYKHETAKMAAEGLAHARAKNCNRFLINFSNATLKDNQSDIYDFNAHLEKTGIKRTDRIAIVVKQSIEAYRFAEMVANNRGWTLIRYFEDMHEAKDWVCK
jgi:hypothetical protein